MMKRCSLLLACLLASCGLPREGPTTAVINHGGAAIGGDGGYQLVELTPGVIADLRQRQVAVDCARPVGHLPAPLGLGLIGPGDLLKITLWETATGSTIGGSTGGPTLDKADLDVTTRVEAGGAISLPLAGRVTAVGLTPAQLEKTLVSAFEHQVVSPQASVLVMEDKTNEVILQGDVVSPGRQALTPGVAMVLDVLALAGGPRQPASKELVRVQRAGQTVTHPLSEILANDAKNLRLGPGDRVAVLPLDRRFYAFGAVNGPGAHSFTEEAPSLIQALGVISGLQDNRADPSGVYVFRRDGDTASEKNMVYHLRMDDPNAFFLAAGFVVRSEDVIFVSNSPVADLAKVLSLITSAGSVAATPRSVSGF